MHCPPKNERGFVLIAAIWLLLLMAAMVAVLMLRGHDRAIEAATDGDQVQTRLLLESGIETVIADILFNGQNSHWVSLPVTGATEIDGTSIGIQVSAEDGRIDLNDVDMETLDAALRGFGVSALARNAFSEVLTARRADNRRIDSWAELQHLAEIVDPSGPGQACFERDMTLYSGQTRPRDRQMSARLARALGVVSADQSGGTLDPGMAIRIVARMPAGASLTAIVRITGSNAALYVVSQWQFNDPCA